MFEHEDPADILTTDEAYFDDDGVDRPRRTFDAQLLAEPVTLPARPNEAGHAIDAPASFS